MDHQQHSSLSSFQFHNTAILESLGYTQDHWIRADRLSAKLAPEFEKTIKFEYKNGNVDKFAVPANSSLFSNNIKKSVASILQMTLKDKMVYYMQEVHADHFYPCLQAKRRVMLTVI